MNANFRASHLMAGVIAAAFMLGVTQSASAGPDVWPQCSRVPRRRGACTGLPLDRRRGRLKVDR
jgi:hypothetical protein